MKMMKIISVALAFLFLCSCGNSAVSSNVVEIENDKTSSHQEASISCVTSEAEEETKMASTQGSGLELTDALDEEAAEIDQSSEEPTPREDSAVLNFMECVWAYDVNSPEETVKNHDYIFTAIVTEVGENYDPFWEPEYIEKHGKVPVYDPCYTRYRLEVTQVLKGNLETGSIIDFRKLGYYDSETGQYYMVEDDVMPAEGEEYLFLASQNTDTGIYGCGAPNTTIPLSADGNEISTYAAGEKMDRQSLIDMYSEIVAEQGESMENNTEDTESTESGTEPDAPEEPNQGAEPEEIQVETPVEVQPESPEEAQAGVTVEP